MGFQLIPAYRYTDSGEEAVLAECLTEEALAKTGNTAPQLHIAKGKLLLQLLTEQYRASIASEAQKSFEQALQLARSQEAKLLELQAAMRLGQLWRLQGKKRLDAYSLRPLVGLLKDLTRRTCNKRKPCYMNGPEQGRGTAAMKNLFP